MQLGDLSTGQRLMDLVTDEPLTPHTNVACGDLIGPPFGNSHRPLVLCAHLDARRRASMKDHRYL